MPGAWTVQLPTYVTFDCYGTLVDFALNRVTQQLLGARADAIPVDDFLRAFEDLRFRAILGPYRPYREVLRQSLAHAMGQFGLPYRDEDGAALVAAVPTFGPFPDVPPALTRLRQRCKLAIISNTDDHLIVGNLDRIEVPIDRVITAEQARAYKPSPVIFDHALEILGCAKEDVLHVAQGFEYDIVPTRRLEWNRVWINRDGKVGDPAYGPYHELPDLSGLPELLGL